MKRIGLKLGLTLTMVLAFGISRSGYAQNFSGGDGSQSSPYLITTAAELAQLATLVNAGDAAYNSKQYKLANDIDLSAYGTGFNDGKGWIPIGKYVWYPISDRHPFKGVFDGDGKKITGLYINDSLLIGAGLFGCVIGSLSTGGYPIGVLDMTVENVNITGGAWVGGVTGYIDTGAILWNCSSSGNIKGGSYVGGLAGQASQGFGMTVLSNCYSSCNVSGISVISSYIGGIVGYVGENTNISKCYSTGNVSGVDFVGGIAGWISRWNPLIKYCYSTGDISGHDWVGGIVGYVYSSFLCQGYSIGSIIGNKHVGGIVGYLGDDCCWNVAVKDFVALNPSVKGNSNVGRVIGSNDYEMSELNNVAYDSILTQAGDAIWNNKGADQIDGEDISKQTINADGTLGGRFTDTVWTTQNGKLPGLFGKTVDMPEHLRIGGTGIVSATLNNLLRVYPNPAGNQLTIDYGAEGKHIGSPLQIEIFDVVGQRVLAPLSPPEGGKSLLSFGEGQGGRLDISHLANGIYFLKIGNNVVTFVKE